MGEVYRAYDTVRGRTVALKLLRPDMAADPSFQDRFRRESRITARLQEPHVIPVHDFGEIDGVLFIDMRLVEGGSVKGELRVNGVLPPARAVWIVSQVASALDAAHANGLVQWSRPAGWRSRGSGSRWSATRTASRPTLNASPPLGRGASSQPTSASSTTSASSGAHRQGLTRRCAATRP